MYYVINGKVVMVLESSLEYVGDKVSPITKGKIQTQSEVSEIYCRNSKTRSLKRFIEAIATQIE